MRPSLLLLALVGFSCGTAAPVTGTFPAKVGPAGGTFTGAADSSFAGVTLEVPAGALSAEVTVDLRPNEEGFALGPGALFVGPAFSFSPEGQAFAKPVKLTLPVISSRLDDVGQSPADCLMWLQGADGSFTQAPAAAFTEDTVTAETTSLRVAAVGARTQFQLPPPHPLVAPCTSPTGFCITPLAERLPEFASNFSNISPGLKLYSVTIRSDAGVRAQEYDLLSGRNVRASTGLPIPPTPSTAPYNFALDRVAMRAALSPDGGVFVPLRNHGLVQLSFGGAATLFADSTATGGTVGVLFTPDGKRHRLYVTGGRAQTSVVRLASTLTGQDQPVEVETASTSDFDSYPFFRVGSGNAIGYLFRASSLSRVAVLPAPPAAGAPMVLHPAITTTGRPFIDEVAVSPDGDLTATSRTTQSVSGQRVVFDTKLGVQSRDGGTSLLVSGLPNLNALEFGEPGALYATGAVSPHVYRIDLSTGGIQTAVLTNDASPAVVSEHIPVALRRFSTAGGFVGMYVITGAPASQRVFLLKPAM